MSNFYKPKLCKAKCWILSITFLAPSYIAVYGNALDTKVILTQNLATVQSIQGNVVDAATGTGMGGVTITVKGSGISSKTDAKGFFTIAAKVGDILVVNYLGYQSIEQQISSSTVSISLNSLETELDEVIVVGYQVPRCFLKH